MNNFYGVTEFGLLEFKDRSTEFEWADIFIEMLVKQKGSDYDKTIQIKGSLEKENGKITGGGVLKRMYHVFDQLGCEAGINVKGEWEDAEGNKIDSISRYLNDNFIKANGSYEPNMDFIAYFYKEKPIEEGGRAYTRAFNKIYRNSNENKAQLEDDVKWMKSKGYLKEVTDEASTPKEMSGNGLANL